MSKSHPYVPSGGIIIQLFQQLRSMFPAKVDAATLKKLSLAPKNESTAISVLKFLDFLDDDCNKTDNANDVFLKHQDIDFQNALEVSVRNSYSEIFNTIGEEAWVATRDQLIGFFRVHDETSAITAKRQAITFETLSSLSGHGESPKIRNNGQKDNINKTPSVKKERKNNTERNPDKVSIPEKKNDLGLTVRIEINLPAQGDQETYDRIFKSIKKNLLDG